MAKSHKVGTSYPGRNLKGREGPQGWILALGSKWVKPQTGPPSPGVLHEGDKPFGFWENSWVRQKGWRSLDATSEECKGTGLPIFRMERALHWWLLPCHSPQSERGEHTGPAHSTSQLGLISGPARPGKKTQSSTQAQPRGAWGVVWVWQQ